MSKSKPSRAFRKASKNPLIDFPDIPNGAPPLDAAKPAHYLPAFKAAIRESQEVIDEIKNTRGTPTFENTIAPLRFSLIGEKKVIGEKFTRVMSVFYNLSVAEAGPEFEKAEKKVEAMTTQFVDNVLMDDKLFKRIKAVYDKVDKSGLSAEQKAVVVETYNIFARNGALLSDKPGKGGSPSPKEQLREVNQNLAGLYAKFGNNAKNATAEYRKVITDESELDGIPDRLKAVYKDNAKKAKLGDNTWVITLAPPPTEVLEYGKNRALRAEIAGALKSRAFGGKYDNRQVVMDIVKERHKKAQLMGYDTFADYMLDDKMAKTKEAVNAFLEENLAAYRPAAEVFLEKVKDYAVKDYKKETGKALDFQASDLAYYARKMKEELFQIDIEKEVKPYFRLENVVEGLHLHVKKMFNADVEEAPKDKYPVFDPDVKAYEIKRDGKLIGVFYADYFARDGVKKDGAWMEIFRNRGLDENGENLPAIVINCCNFQKPPAGEPCLLSLRDATTVFHEFGHALHALLSKGDYQMLTGYRVKQDAVETNSQLQENWVWEEDVLATFARNDKGEVISPAVVKKLRDMENFDAGLAGLRQTFFGLLDMKWHGTDPAKLKSVEAVEDEMNTRAGLFERIGAQSTAFSHLFKSDEYAAGYYGYKWSEVLEADIFSAFRKLGIYNKEMCQKLEDTIYAQGGQRDYMALFVDLMGRKPDPSALFTREGIEAPGKTPANANAPQDKRKLA